MRNQKKMLLVAINAKYIHSNLGIHSIQKYCRKQGVEVETGEYTINHRMDSVLSAIYERKPDVLAFSCYIWNIACIKELAEDFHAILPEVPIWFGGPEVSYLVEEQMEKYPFLSGIMYGEGEATVAHLKKVLDGEGDLSEVAGIAYRDGGGNVVVNRKREPLPMDEIPFAYDDLTDFKNRIIYYESSRGCPFSCSYCLSAAECGTRFRSMELVERELDFFLEHKVPQVKFVDRTFNANPAHTMAIWKYIFEHDNGVTNFHFEIAADLLRDEEVEYISQFRPGLIQLEIGLQSTNLETIDAIHRKMNLQRLREVVAQIRKGRNIHQHLDLIAGLPYEDFASFQKSFDDVYDMRPDQLQLGFLKVLTGSPLHKERERFGIVAEKRPPYEVLFTKWLSYEETTRLKEVEEMVEVYYNSGQFQAALSYLNTLFSSAFSLYESLAGYYKERGLDKRSHTRMRRYEILLSWGETLEHIDTSVLKQTLVYDLYARERLKSRPAFAGELLHVPGSVRTKGKTLHWEAFDYDMKRLVETGEVLAKPCVYEFDYNTRNPLDHQAQIREV